MATVLVGLGCLIGVNAVQVGAQAVGYPVQPYDSDAGGSLHDAEGRPITNIYAYDSDGRLLDGVLLYDQAGRPLEDVSQVTEAGHGVRTNYRLDANGAPVRNAYPLDIRILTGVEPWTEPDRGFRPAEPAPAQPMRPPAVVVPPPTTPTTAATPPTTAG